MKTKIEQSLIIIKPDGVQRGLIGEIVSRFENKGLKIIGMKMLHLTDKLLEEHYFHHKNKPFFPAIVRFMKSAPSVFLVLEGLDCVEVVRKMCGPTHGGEAPSGTIRGDFSLSVQCNIIHASDSADTAEKEVKRFFKKEELYPYTRIDFEMVYGEDERK